LAKQGWISLHRSIQDNWLWDEKPYDKARAWIDILLMVNHEKKRVLLGSQLIDVDKGEKITSIRKLSDRWGWSTTKTEKFLKVLESDKMLVVKKDTKKTVIKVLNYAIYQDSKKEESNTEVTPKSHRSNTEVTPKNTNNNDNNANNENKGAKPNGFFFYTFLNKRVALCSFVCYNVFRNEVINMDLAEKIIEFRAVNGMTQDEFATAVGIDRTSILHIEARNRVPRKVTAKRIEIFIDNYNKEKGK